MVSIIIPAYNTEKYIAETINSVISQTYIDWELIVIDDGSTDNTADIVKEFCKNDKRINYYYQNNTGVSIARNNGMQKIKGDYIALLDADDIWETNNLEEKISVLSSTKDIGWVYSNMYNADENGNIIDIAASGHGINILDSILLWEGEVVPGPCSNIVFRKECFDNGLSFDKLLSTAADQDFCIQLASKYKGVFIDEVLLKYRVLENSMSRNISIMEKDHIGVFNKAAKNKLFKSFWFKQKCFSNLYWILAGSWWKDGNNKKRGFYFVLKALFTNPLSIFKLFSKIVK